MGCNSICRLMNLTTFSWTSSNGLANTLTYDSDARPTSISVPNMESLAFTYDAANRINHLTNGMDKALTQACTYDAMSRLTGVTSTADNESYAYDADGNRIHQVVNGASVGFEYPTTSNRLVQLTDAWSTTWSYFWLSSPRQTSHETRLPAGFVFWGGTPRGICERHQLSRPDLRRIVPGSPSGDIPL